MGGFESEQEEAMVKLEEGGPVMEESYVTSAIDQDTMPWLAVQTREKGKGFANQESTRSQRSSISTSKKTNRKCGSDVPSTSRRRVGGYLATT